MIKSRTTIYHIILYCTIVCYSVLCFPDYTILYYVRVHEGLVANAVVFRDLLPSPQTNCVTQLLFVWRQAPLTNYDLAAGASHVLDTELHMS